MELQIVYNLLACKLLIKESDEKIHVFDSFFMEHDDNYMKEFY